jgi:hypothetical protein
MVTTSSRTDYCFPSVDFFFLDGGSPKSGSRSPSGGSISITPSRTDTVGTISVTNGTSSSPQQFAGGRVQDLADGADLVSAVGATCDDPHRQPFEFVVVELVRIVGRRKVGTVDDEQHPAQRVCGVATVDALQAQQKPPGVFPGGFHCVLVQVLVARLASTQNRADGEALLGFVGANLDDDFASDAVRLGHTAHDELHRRSPSGRCRRRRHGYPGHRFR